MVQEQENEKRENVLRRGWKAFSSPAKTISLGALIIVGGMFGVIFWGGFNWAMEMTNTEKFCISCHEMKDFVYEEYTETVHYTNRSGVRAICTDCHVPKEWIHKVARKIRATGELYHKVIGSISTKEKFEAKRLELAQRVWTSMKATDSRECRNCHEADSMDFDKQESRSADRHEEGFDEGKTCIDCHKGIAHKLPKGAFEDKPQAGLKKDAIPQTTAMALSLQQFLREKGR
ncbi:Cytochrome c-type protein NapC [hydrothermal vent metagenome]|uniref:Cytochrome c-type protein NapC n=1 Tax=hydrothermal vent metagenome TaxID=652676 RepID=A0A3B0UDX8_9ZZZZ